jgi:hypothetical protein
MPLVEEDNPWENKIVSYINDDIDGKFFNNVFHGAVEVSWRSADCAIRLIMALIMAPKAKVTEEDLDKRGIDPNSVSMGLEFTDPFFAGYIIGMGEMYTSYTMAGVFGADTTIPAVALYKGEERLMASVDMMSDYDGCGPNITSPLVGLGGLSAAIELLKMLRFPTPPTMCFDTVTEEERHEWEGKLLNWYNNYQLTRQLAIKFEVHLSDHISAIEEAEVSDALSDFDDQLKSLLGGN